MNGIQFENGPFEMSQPLASLIFVNRSNVNDILIFHQSNRIQRTEFRKCDSFVRYCYGPKTHFNLITEEFHHFRTMKFISKQCHCT